MRDGWDDAGGGLGRVPGVWEAHGTRCAVAGKPKVRP